MVKAYVSEELFKVADRCVQILGGIGISDETPVGMIFSDMRAFRLYDGPTEVHKYAIARQVLRCRSGKLVMRASPTAVNASSSVGYNDMTLSRPVNCIGLLAAELLATIAIRIDLLTFPWVAAKIRRPTEAMKVTSESSMTRTGGSSSSAATIAASKAGAVLKSISPPMLTTATPSR